MKVVALTVTYNRLDWLKKNVAAILAQTYPPDEFVIVDNNSTDGTKVYLSKLEAENENVTVVYLPENVGGSGGFAAGMKVAYEKGMDYIWGMDDDAVPRNNALEKLIHSVDKYPSRRFCMRSNIHFIDKNGKFVRKQFEKTNEELLGITFVGFFIPREIVTKIGFPREDLFIYYDDADYSMSIKENGFTIISVSESVIEHPNIMPDNKKKILGRQINVPEMPKWKFYYWMRNNLLIRRGKASRDYGKAIMLELYILLKLLFLKPSMFGISLKGFYHGIIGKTGRLEKCP